MTKLRRAWAQHPANLIKKSRRYLPRSAFGQAIDYALSNWPLLGVYLEDGRLELDNNLVENAIRPTALGKQNWLFFGDANAGQPSAILYTIIESRRCRGIDPYVYLRERAHQASFNDQLAGHLPRPGRKLRAPLRADRGVANRAASAIETINACFRGRNEKQNTNEPAELQL